MGGLKTRTMQYLGLVAVQAREGFTIPNKSFPALQVCDQCGAVVPRSSQEKHTSWHQQQQHRP